ncbi:MAG: hypothetical protein IT209_11910, partial [Armatimonadetes bacterium]|nr:hypothetical protein [Armatimonadota bacterium]
MSANILNKPKDANVFSKPLKSAISDQSLSLLPVLQDSVSKAVTELKAMGQSDLRAVIAKAIDHARDQLWKFTDHHVCEWERQCLDNLKFRLRSLKFEERVSDLRDVEEKLEDGKVKLYGISHNIHTEVNRLWKDLQFELNTTPQPVSGMNGICKSNLRDLQYSIIQNTVLELYVDSPEGLPKIAARVLSAVTDLRTQAEQDAKTLVQIEGTLRNQLTALRCEIPDVVSNADRDFLENIQGSVSKWLHGRLHCREIGWIGRQEPRALVEELLRKTS